MPFLPRREEGHPISRLTESDPKGCSLKGDVKRNNSPLDRLLRYEASLERTFDRTLNQLERLQRMRLGQPVPPPVKVELS